MSMLVRRPANIDLSPRIRRGSKSAYGPADKEHVRNKYPQTGSDIIQRLGRAITNRRNYLDCLAQEHTRLQAANEEVESIRRPGTDEALSVAVAASHSDYHVDTDGIGSNLGMSEISHAVSLRENFSDATVPPPPKLSKGGNPFECPYCFFRIQVKSLRSWNRHIVKDIKPYTCVFSACSMPEKLFESRREWFLHEVTEHHVAVESLGCPLCGESLRSKRHFKRHIARYLEELALIILPRPDSEDYDDAILDELSLESESESESDSDGDDSELSVEHMNVQDGAHSLEQTERKQDAQTHSTSKEAQSQGIEKRHRPSQFRKLKEALSRRSEDRD